MPTKGAKHPSVGRFHFFVHSAGFASPSYPLHSPHSWDQGETKFI